MATTANAEQETNDIVHDFVNVWAVHAEREGQPWLRDWARSENEAKEKLADCQGNDDDASETEYWIMQMTRAELESFQSAGVIPQDAG